MAKYIVSGASSGLGFAIARRFQRGGDRVIGIGRRETSFVNTFCDHPIEYYPIDYTKSYSFGKIDSGSEIDGIVHCSAQFKMAPLSDHAHHEIVDMISVNLTSVIRFVRYFQPLMKPNGTILLVSSVAGLKGQKHQTVYSATKHAMMGFADSLRQEVSQKVTTICPGGINTPLWNEDNPYPGNVEDLLQPENLASFIHDIMVWPKSLVVKNVTLHPESESH